MALWGLAWLGSTPIGGPIVGWVAQTAGARWGLVIGGLPTVVIGILALPALNRIDARRAEEPEAVPSDSAAAETVPAISVAADMALADGAPLDAAPVDAMPLESGDPELIEPASTGPASTDPGAMAAGTPDVPASRPGRRADVS